MPVQSVSLLLSVVVPVVAIAMFCKAASFTAGALVKVAAHSNHLCRLPATAYGGDVLCRAGPVEIKLTITGPHEP
jgi:hypothetical protein